MKTISKFVLTLLLSGILLTGCAVPKPAASVTATATAFPAPAATPAVNNLHWFGTSSILYHGSLNIYFDPVDLEGNVPVADIVLISNGQNSYCNIDALKKIVGPQTTVLISANAAVYFDKYQGELAVKPVVMEVGQKLDAKGATVEAVTLQNSGGHHPIQDGLGYLINLDGIRVYYAGPTVFYPEMSALKSDLAIYPATSQADIDQAAGVLPTKTMVLVNTSATFAQIVAKALTQSHPGIQFVALEPGPYTP
jgi:L-ascorbate metabolism protein UlaG (beta-lactamase superfamily)